MRPVVVTPPTTAARPLPTATPYSRVHTRRMQNWTVTVTDQTIHSVVVVVVAGAVVGSEPQMLH